MLRVLRKIIRLAAKHADSENYQDVERVRIKVEDNHPEIEVVQGDFDFPPIPKELEYLLEPGVYYGTKYRFDDAQLDFRENGKDSEVKDLAALAERVRLSGDYARFDEWTEKVDETVENIVDETYPYAVEISECRKKRCLSLVNPEKLVKMTELQRQRLFRESSEMNDSSDLAKCRRTMRTNLISQADEKVHYMTIYFMFGLMLMCDMDFE